MYLIGGLPSHTLALDAPPADKRSHSHLTLERTMTMEKLQLPVIDPAWTEFGYARTICACHDCAAGCRHLPGYLIPADLERLHNYLAPAEDLLAWARGHLLASPGALV